MTRDHRTVIPERFSGFPGIAHGGYVGGLVAAYTGGSTVEVRLRRPVRTGAPLNLEPAAPDRTELRDEETLMAEGAATRMELEVPEPVSLAEAESASARYPGGHDHLYPMCFGCGPARADGLRIFPGPVPGRRLVAATWIPRPSDADADGIVPVELVWAALDCPQLWSLILHAPSRTNERIVTSALAVKLQEPVVAGEPLVVMAWPSDADGPRWCAYAALMGSDGAVRATGRQIAVSASWGVPLGLSRWRANHSASTPRL